VKQVGTDMHIVAIEKWLMSKGTTLWADWDISQPDRRRKAAEWFAAQQADLMGWLASSGKR